MSAQQPAQNDSQTPGSEDSGKNQPLRTRYYYLIMTIMIMIDVVVDIATFIEIITNAEGRIRIPYLVFTLPVVGALTIGKFADAALAKKSPHLVPSYTTPYFQGGQAPQQGQHGQPQYGQPTVQSAAPQSAGYDQIPGQQITQGASQQAPHSRPQQQSQVPPSDQYGQDSQNWQLRGQGGRPGRSGPVGY